MNFKIVKKKCVNLKKANTLRKEVLKGEKPSSKAFRLSSKVYFLTYKGVTDIKQVIIKKNLANYLFKQNPLDKKLRPLKYLVCEQMYESGKPHFHVILIYPKRKEITLQTHYDFMGIHPNIQIMRNMKAALEYVYKQDPKPYTNMDIIQEQITAKAKHTSSLYQLLEQQMKKDPFNFNVIDYCQKHNIFKQIYKTNFTKALTLLKLAQQAQCRACLISLPGIKLITRSLIEVTLTKEELIQYDSWKGYSDIISHINQMIQYPNKNELSRLPDKTPHLYLCGRSDIGKSALVSHHPTLQYPYPGLDHYFSTYYLNVSQRYFPPYTSYMSTIVRWNQFTINSSIFPKKRYNQLLDYLEGAPTQIPIKGRLPVRRMDNPKHILTSNLTLQDQICRVFKSEQSRSKARMNLRSRLDEIIVPPKRSLHLLRKLFIKK